jgi:hypothetical protein
VELVLVLVVTLFTVPERPVYEGLAVKDVTVVPTKLVVGFEEEQYTWRLTPRTLVLNRDGNRIRSMDIVQGDYVEVYATQDGLAYKLKVLSPK